MGYDGMFGSPMWVFLHSYIILVLNLLETFSLCGVKKNFSKVWEESGPLLLHFLQDAFLIHRKMCFSLFIAKKQSSLWIKTKNLLYVSDIANWHCTSLNSWILPTLLAGGIECCSNIQY